MMDAKSVPDRADEATDTSKVDFRTARFTSSWREEALARICELRVFVDALSSREGLDTETAKLLEGAKIELAHASQSARRREPRRTLSGAAVQRVHGHLDAAEILVLRAAPLPYIRGH